MLDDDERVKKSLGSENTHPNQKLGRENQRFGNDKAWIINDSGLYTLIIRSNLPVAKKFRKWVTSEVLPSIRKTGSYSINAAYPGSMTPTNCIVLTCHTADGGSKQAYLMYDSGDMWFGCHKQNPDYENVLQSSIKRIGDIEDATVWYETRGYSLKNGIYEASPFLYPKHDKRPKVEGGNPVTNCQKAIERYRKAAEDVKASAGAMIEYLKC